MNLPNGQKRGIIEPSASFCIQMDDGIGEIVGKGPVEVVAPPLLAQHAEPMPQLHNVLADT